MVICWDIIKERFYMVKPNCLEENLQIGSGNDLGRVNESLISAQFTR